MYWLPPIVDASPADVIREIETSNPQTQADIEQLSRDKLRAVVTDIVVRR